MYSNAPVSPSSFRKLKGSCRPFWLCLQSPGGKAVQGACSTASGESRSSWQQR